MEPNHKLITNQDLDLHLFTSEEREYWTSIILLQIPNSAMSLSQDSSFNNTTSSSPTSRFFRRILNFKTKKDQDEQPQPSLTGIPKLRQQLARIVDAIKVLEEVRQVPKATTAQGQSRIKPTIEEMDAQRAERDKKPHEEHNGQVRKALLELAAPLAAQEFRVVPVNVEDQVLYVVTDVSGENYTVQLNPTLGKCNCPSKFFCHHLLAVRFRAGVQADLKIPSNAKLPPQPADMDIVEAEKAFSAPAAPAAATEDPVITAKREALTAEVRKCMNAKMELNAAHSQAAQVDLELLETYKLTMDDFRSREAEREMAFEDLTVKLKNARQARKAFLEEVSKHSEKALCHPKEDLNLDLKIRNQLQHDISQALFYLTLYFQ